MEWSPSPATLLEFGAQVAVARGRPRRSAVRLADRAGDDVRRASQHVRRRRPGCRTRWSPTASVVVLPGVRVEHWQIAASDRGVAVAARRVAARLVDARPRRVQRSAAGAGPRPIAARHHAGDTLAPERARVIDLGVEQRFGEAWRASITGYYRREARSPAPRQQRVPDRQRTGGAAECASLSRQRHGRHGARRRADGRAPVFERSHRAGCRTRGGTPRTPTKVSERRGADVAPETFPADWDQRHTLNANVAYRWSERSSIAVRYRYGSNFPLQGYLRPARR